MAPAVFNGLGFTPSVHHFSTHKKQDCSYPSQFDLCLFPRLGHIRPWGLPWGWVGSNCPISHGVVVYPLFLSPPIIAHSFCFLRFESCLLKILFFGYVYMPKGFPFVRGSPFVLLARASLPSEFSSCRSHLSFVDVLPSVGFCFGVPLSACSQACRLLGSGLSCARRDSFRAYQ